MPEAFTTDDAIKAVVELKEHMQSQTALLEENKRTVAELNEKQAKLEDAIRQAEQKMATKTTIPEYRGSLSRFKGCDPDLPQAARQKAYDELIEQRTPSHFTPEDNALVEELKAKNDEVFILHQCAINAKHNGDRKFSRMNEQEIFYSLDATKDLLRLQRALREKVPAQNTSDTGEGVEWVPTGLSNQITELAERELRVAALFDSFDMPTDPYDWPFSKENPQARVVSQSTSPVNPFAVSQTTGLGSSFSDANPTGKVTFAGKKLKSDLILTGEFRENTIAAAIPSLSQNIGRSIGRALDDGVLNGDDDATHFDADINESGTLPEVLFRGLRWYAFEGNTGGIVTGAAVSTGDSVVFKIIDTMKAMGTVYGADPNDLALIVSMSTYGDLLKSDRVLTLDKFGSNATIMRGQLGAVLGIPIIVSAYMRTDVDTIGYRTLANTAGATTSAILTYRPGWKMGVARRPTFETMRLIPSDQEYMVSFWRGDFEEMHNTGQKIVGLIRNLPV
ncbi:MAG: hypothetical protein ACE5FA_01760 [Dehalococcoidia bacterium]